LLKVRYILIFINMSQKLTNYSGNYLNRTSVEPTFVFGIDRCSVYTG